MKCICFNRDLSEIRELALKNDWSVEETIAKTGCGTRCGMCIKLIEEYLDWKQQVEKGFIEMYDQIRDEEQKDGNV